MRPKSLREGLQAERKRRPFICDPLLPDGGVLTIHSSPKSLKSMLGKNAGLQIADGGKIWCKWKTKEGVVLYLAQEDTEDMLVDSLEKIHGYENFFRAMDNFYYVCKANLQLDQKADRDQLLQFIEKVDANVVILDPWSELQPFDDSETNKQLKVLRDIRKLKDNLSLIIVHHDCKPGEHRSGGRSWDMRGAALRQASDAIVSVTRTQNRKGVDQVRLSFELRYGKITLPVDLNYDELTDTFSEVTKG